MSGIFETYAPLYWGAGIQVLPLAPGQKRPIPQKWSQWNNERQTETIKQAWLESYPNANIGCIPGPVSNICFVDIDIAEEGLLREAIAMFPPSPWKRIGKKGCVLAFKWCDTKSFKVFEAEGTYGTRDRYGIEFFSSSGQVVMPPSIHPDTQMPYTANCDLWTVKEQLPEIDGAHLEAKIREFFGNKKMKVQVKGRAKLGEHVSRGTRDVTMVKLSGLYANMILRGEVSLREALDYMDVWGSEFVQDVEGDSLDIQKGKLKIVEYLVKDVHDRKRVLPKGWDAGLDEGLIKDLDLGRITAEDVSFDFDQIKDEFDNRLTEIEKEGKGDSARFAAVEKLVERCAKSTSLSDLEQEKLYDHVRHQIEGVTKATLRKMFVKKQASTLEGESHMEIAEDYIKNHDDIEQRFDRGNLWEWMGSHWAKRNRDAMMQEIIRTYGNLPAARKHNDHKGIFNTVCSLLAGPIKTSQGYGINFTNGYLDTDLRLGPHAKEYGLVYELPYAYDPEQPEPKMFISFLERLWPNDPEMIDLIQEALAVTMFGMAPKYQKCFLLYGVAASGKSVLMEILGALFPREAQCALPPHRWHEKFLIGVLDGPLLNLAGELPEVTEISSQIFKQAVNGEQLTGEHKNKDPFQFAPVAAHWFASNHLPRTKDTSAGFTRRWMILPFLHVVPEAERNVNLAQDILANEREAIVAWAVQAIGRVIRRGHLIVPATVAAMSEELGALLNPIKVWFNEVVKVGEGTLTDERAYLSYQTFSLQKGFKKLERGIFKATMRELAGLGAFKVMQLPDGSQKYEGISVRKLGQNG